jgi:hypothetical protein
MPTRRPETPEEAEERILLLRLSMWWDTAVAGEVESVRVCRITGAARSVDAEEADHAQPTKSPFRRVRR